MHTPELGGKRLALPAPPACPPRAPRVVAPRPLTELPSRHHSLGVQIYIEVVPVVPYAPAPRLGGACAAIICQFRQVVPPGLGGATAQLPPPLSIPLALPPRWCHGQLYWHHLRHWHYLRPYAPGIGGAIGPFLGPCAPCIPATCRLCATHVPVTPRKSALTPPGMFRSWLPLPP